MIPKILEYEDERIKITAEAYSIPEVKAIIDRYELGAEPYLAYVHLMTVPNSPYKNLPEEERKEQIIFDVNDSHGNFDPDDDLLETAVNKCKSLYESPAIQMANELEEELHRFRKLLRDTPLTGDNFKDRKDYMKDVDKILTTYSKVKKQADEELDIKMKGKSQLGEY